MAAAFGKIDEFDAYSDQNWDEYIERLEHYFVANEVDDASKKRSILLTVCGHKTYSLIRSLVSPDKPGDKTYDVLKTLIHNYLKPKPLVIAERFKFHQRKQGDSESVSQYLTELRKLSEHCQFQNFLNDALRDRFVCGLSSVAIQRKLLSEADLTLKKASDIALSMEMAEREAKKLSSEIIEKANNISIQCFRCGKSNHQAGSCFHKKSTCHKCQKVGHLSKMCQMSTRSRGVEDYPTEPGKSKNQGRVTSGGWKGQVKKKVSKVNRVEEYDSTAFSDVSDEEEKEGWPIFTIKSENRKEIKVKLKIDGQPLEMEIDTGASVSLIPESLYNKELRDTVSLKSSSVILRTYTGQTIPVLGELTVQVEYESQKVKLPLLVVKSEGPALFGRNWLRQLRLNWRAIHYSMTSNTPNIKELSEVYAVFDEGLGTVKGITATLKVKPGAQPKFFKPRPVPFASKDRIADELLRLEREGIVEKVDSS